MLRLIDELAAGGKTVLMSAHLLLEAEGLADQVVTMEQGRDVVTGRPDDLVRRFFPRPMVAFDAEDRAALDRLAHLPGVTGYTRDGGAGGAIVTVDDLSRVPALVAELVSAGVRLTEVTPHHPSLEQLYLKVRNAA